MHWLGSGAEAVGLWICLMSSAGLSAMLPRMFACSARSRALLWALMASTLLLGPAAFGSASALAADEPKPAAKKVDLLEQAQELFDDQRYEESIQTLSGALLRPGQSKELRIKLYKLLTFNYITIGRKEEGESAARGLFAIDPAYELPKSESPKFRDFFVDAKKKWEAEGRPGMAAPEKIVLRHQVPSEATPKQDFEVKISVEASPKAVVSLKVFFRNRGEAEYRDVPAPLIGSLGIGVIPSSAMLPPFVEYYAAALDGRGNVIGTRGDASDPLRVSVPDSGGKGGWILPVVLVGSVLGAGAIVGGLALAGVFKGATPVPQPNPPEQKRSNVTVVVGESARFRGFQF
jgi:hypothetical protein